MANGQGSAVLDFGALPGSNEAQVSVADATVSATSKAEAYLMGDDTSADHTAGDHRYAGCFCALTCGTPTAGVGFVVFGRAVEQLVGKFTVRYVWSD
jgi:hypothetical protein